MIDDLQMIQVLLRLRGTYMLMQRNHISFLVLEISVK